MLAALFLSLGLSAQFAADALRYSYQQTGGSARFIGTGGSMGALGGDYSSTVSNPAGLATFRRSELSLTPSYYYGGTTSTFAGNESERNIGLMTFNQGALIIARKKPGNWKSTNFSIGYNRLADYNQDFIYSGNTVGSLGDYFVTQAQGLFPDQLSSYESGLAYDAGVIYNPPGQDADFYENDVQAGQSIDKSERYLSRGNLGEMGISLAGNYNHKLYLGVTLGITFVNYDLTKTYTETDPDDNIVFLNDMTFRQFVNTDGTGVNLKVGAIYRVNQALRIGGAIHTPTGFSLTDRFRNEIDFSYQADPNNPLSTVETQEQSPEGVFEYNLRTPWRFVGNVGYIIKKNGFITAEVEYLNYGSARYNFDSDFATAEDLAIEAARNTDISNFYKDAINVNVGGEIVLAEDFRLRAGYRIFGSPYEGDAEFINASQISAGFGYRKDNFYLDFAYAKRLGDEFYSPYQSDLNPQQVSNSLDNDIAALTFGWKFGR